MTPEIALQRALRARLVDTPGVTDLVPADAILDRNARPAPSPSIILGEGQSVDEGDSIKRTRVRVYMDLHIWKKENSTEGVKEIAGAIRAAIRARLMHVAAGIDCHFIDCHVQSTRFMRDPDGETSHAIVTVSAKVQEL